MGIYGFWWFFKVEDCEWDLIKSEFDRAAVNIVSLLKVQPLPLRPVAPPVTARYGEAIAEGVLAGAELGKQLFHRPFQDLAFKILSNDESDERLVGLALQSRVLPTVVLMTGIGRERFAQLPGYLGNLLLHSQDVAIALESVSRALDVDWESYSAKAKCTLASGGPPGSDVDLDDNRDVTETLHALPIALQQVKNERAGLLVLSSWGTPDQDDHKDLDSVAEEDDIAF
jgi:hypothetical protein